MATETFSATPSPAPSAELGEFRVNAPTEVQALLRTLLQQQTRVTLSSADGASLHCQLSVLDAELGMLGFEPSPGQSPAQMQALLGSDEISAVAYLDQIRLQFELDALMLVSSAEAGQRPVLRGAVPAQLWRFQRRQAFRVRPTKRTPNALLPHPEGEVAQALRILDLSIGGLALLLPAGQAVWPLGSQLQARIELDRDTRFAALLSLQHVQTDPLSGNTQLGLAFAQIEPAAARDLQRYIDQTQKLARLLGQ